MQQYSIILINEKVATYRYVTLFILLINVLFFGFFYFTTGDAVIKNASLSGAVISGISLILFFLKGFTKKLFSSRFEFSLIALSISWLVLEKYLVALCMLLFAVIGFYTNKKFIVLLTPSKIVYPAFPKKIILWSEVNNVMLKDNMLTIDLKNNKLMQAVVEKESGEIIHELSFNEFCKKQLSKGLSDP